MVLKCVLLLIILINMYESSPFATRSNCVMPSLENGRVKIRQRMRLIKYFCNEGFQLLGNTYATCRNGEWDNPEPFCIRTGCASQKIKHGMEVPMRGGAMVIYFCMPGYKLVGSSVLHCNGRNWNASMPTCVDSNATAELSCDFEDPAICGWTQDELHDFDWKRFNKKTPSSFLFTGPSSDHTLGAGKNGYYMYIESTSRDLNDTARLLSPIYKQHLSVNGCFSFYYHMFGKSIGGLRVFQKPDNISLQEILRASGQQMKKYLLFEQWGNLGDTWYGSVSSLKNFGDDFQIIIEAIRGHSVTSDIAIDDVAILQGDECTTASQSATTPTSNVADSCVGRCDIIGKNAPDRGCGCTSSCFADSDCCYDFYDVCVFTGDESYSVDINNGPQTEKLVASPPTESTVESDYHEVPKTTESTTKITKLITTTTIQTTPTTVLTTTPTTKLITTQKMPITVFLKTTPKPPFNGGKINFTTSPAPTNKTTLVTTTKSTFVNLTNSKKDAVTKATIVTTLKNVDVNLELKSNNNNEDNASSGAKGAAIVVGVLLCLAGCVYLFVTYKGSKGLSIVAKLRGNVQNDPEVRFLTREDDDEDCS